MPVSSDAYQMGPARAVVILHEDGTALVLREVQNWSMEMETETLEHRSARNGFRQVDHEVVTGMTFNLTASARRGELVTGRNILPEAVDEALEALTRGQVQEPEDARRRVIRFLSEHRDEEEHVPDGMPFTGFMGE